MINYDNTPIRRQDRLLEEEKALQLLTDGEYGILSMATDEGAYGIPLNYVWDKKTTSIYIHCAPEGRKLSLLARNPRISFCVVGTTQVLPGKFTTAYESIVLSGTAVTDLSDEEKQKALELIVGKYSSEFAEVGMKYIAKSFARTAIIRLDLTGMSGKTKRMG